MISKQGKTLAQSDDMWKFLASGNYEVDSVTKAKAQKDVAKDGYWGVEQTSDRIVSFTKALTGGDPSKIYDMRDAFKNGFDAATKAWGKDLPSITKDTYDAVMKKFDTWEAESETTITTVTQ